MNNPHKAFLEACSTVIGATALHPRERLVFLVIAWLGEEATRKDVIEFTKIDKAHVSRMIAKLKTLHLLTKEGKLPQSCHNGNTSVATVATSCQESNTSVATVATSCHNGNNSKDQQQEVYSPPQCPPSSSPPNPLNNNPPFIPPSRVMCACEDAFDEWWANYPPTRRREKAVCKQIYFKIVDSGVETEDINAGLMRHVMEWQTNKVASAYIPHAKTWLNGKRWELELPMERETKVEKRPTYTKDEEAFLNVWGKKPRFSNEVEDFKHYFKRACEDVGDPQVVIAAARIAYETMMLDEGSVRFQKKPHVWLDDCGYRQFLDRARRTAGTRQAINSEYVPIEGCPL